MSRQHVTECPMSTSNILYSGKVWRVESLVNLASCLQFAKLKPSKLVVTINNPLAELFIHRTFFCQKLEKSKFAKHSPRQTFPLYGSHTCPHVVIDITYNAKIVAMSEVARPCVLVKI